ncbi:MAG: RnfABCDGE type electron transport complex subunit G [Lentisphaeria bacterium]|nr:RnfABCDGE type electron transport complex subunit G [Lentisphaeria bacterium]
MSKNSSNLFYLGVFLCLVCAAAAAIMGSAAVLTREPIEKAKVKKVSDGLREVLPAFDNDPMKDSSKVGDVLLYHAKKDGKTVGFAAETSVSSGYGGRIKALISFHPDGSIRTFIVTDHKETPGLGSQAVDRVRKKTLSDLIRGEKEPEGLAPNRILDQYAGHSGVKTAKDAWKRPWKLKKDGGDAEHVTGATISSRAVNELAWKAAAAFEKYQASLKEGKSK